MRKTLLTLITTFHIFACHAQIIQTHDMKDVFEALEKADRKTLAIFDVDMVLIQPSDPAFQMANMKRYNSIAKKITKEVPADKHILFFSLMTTQSHPVLIDKKTPQYLKKIAEKGIPSIGLTAYLTGKLGSISKIEQLRIKSLKHLGIDFSKTAPYKKSLVFDNLTSYRGNYSTYLDGILFVNGTEIPKGDVLLAFLKKTHFLPKKVVFIDDREGNLQSVERALQNLDPSIEYQGFHYLGADNYLSKRISEEEFKSQWEKLASEVHDIN